MASRLADSSQASKAGHINHRRPREPRPKQGNMYPAFVTSYNKGSTFFLFLFLNDKCSLTQNRRNFFSFFFLVFFFLVFFLGGGYLSHGIVRPSGCTFSFSPKSVFGWGNKYPETRSLSEKRTHLYRNMSHLTFILTSMEIQ